MNYYKRHLGDYAKDTGHLSMLEHGAYTMLMDRYYATEIGIPADQAYRVSRARSKEERDAVDVVLKEFFTLKGQLWIKNRIEEEIRESQTKINAARENGKGGGRPKKNQAANPEQTEEKPSGFSVGSETKTESITQTKALHSPLSTLHTPEEQDPRIQIGAASRAERGGERKVSKPPPAEPEGFAELQQMYPKRGGGQRWGDARTHYRARLREGHTPEIILAGVKRYAEFVRETGKERTEHVQQAATFLGTNCGFLEAWALPRAPPEHRQLSAVERVRMANGGEAKRDERVVSEQRNGQGFSDLELFGGDVRQPPSSGLRRIGS